MYILYIGLYSFIYSGESPKNHVLNTVNQTVDSNTLIIKSLTHISLASLFRYIDKQYIDPDQNAASDQAV